MTLLICNRAGSCYCSVCDHAKPHEETAEHCTREAICGTTGKRCWCRTADEQEGEEWQE